MWTSYYETLTIRQNIKHIKINALQVFRIAYYENFHTWIPLLWNLFSDLYLIFT